MNKKPQFNSTVLTSDAYNFDVNEAINPYYIASEVNSFRAEREHQQLQNLLIEAGINIIQVPSPLGCQDGVYTANWALVRNNKAVIANLPDARKHEEIYAEKILSDLGKEIIRIPKNLKFSGQGDALPCGDLLFCGNGYRSDEEAQKIAAEALGYQRIQLKTIPLLDQNHRPVINSSTGWNESYFYDIDLALAIIRTPTDKRRGLIAYCQEAFIPESQNILNNLKDLDKILVTIQEAKNGFATNLISTGDTVTMSANAPLLTKELKNHGLRVQTIALNEISKGGGFIRCMALTLD
ncbi:MAG: hypothetical protein WBI29_00990 [Candidatus Saccharimonadales bacterium]